MEQTELMNKKEEHWLQLPESIYGSGVCYLIVYSELLKQLEGLTTDAVDFSRSFNEIKNLKGAFPGVDIGNRLLSVLETYLCPPFFATVNSAC